MIYLIVATANMCWSKRNQKGRVKAYLAYLCKHADIILLQECRDVRLVADGLLPRGFSTNQDISNAGTRGSCVVWRDSAVQPTSTGMILGARGAQINPRWLSWIVFLGINWVAAHAPLWGTGLQGLFVRREKAFLSARPRVVIGTDANRRVTRLGKTLRMEAHEAPGNPIVGQLFKGVKATKVWADPTGVHNGWTDHPAFFSVTEVSGNTLPTPVGGNMSGNCVIDESFGHENIDALKRAGYLGIMGYVSRDARKNMTRLRAAQAHTRGMGVGLVFEDAAARALSGFFAGQADARFARNQADALGYPAKNLAPIFFAVDADVSPQAVIPYFQGMVSVLGREQGAYGDTRVIRALHAVGLIKYMWDTTAWSGGVVASEANLFQRVTPTHGLKGPFDENLVMHPFPMWGTGSTRPTPKPKPAPKPVTRGPIVDQLIIDTKKAIARAHGAPPRVAKLQHSLDTLNSIAPL